MSMQRECLTVEVEPGKWFCIVARDEYGDIDKNSISYGPQPTEDEAFEAMRDNEPNPGGNCTVEATPELKQLIKKTLHTRSGRPGPKSISNLFRF